MALYTFNGGVGGGNNTFLGRNSAASRTTGNQNQTLGEDAHRSITTGSANVAIGYQSAYSNLSGSNNINLGSFAGYGNTSDNNINIGFDSNSQGAVVANIVAIGYQALRNNQGSQHVAVGAQAGTNTTGNTAVYIGYKAGFNITAASNNTVIGALNFDSGHTTGAANTLIGAGLTGYGNVSNTIIISDGSNTKNLVIDAASARFKAPVTPGSYSVSGLPSASAAGIGAICYANNGRKAGEGASAGTGCPVFSSGSAWLCFYNNLSVTA
jgi:hypothetical protein